MKSPGSSERVSAALLLSNHLRHWQHREVETHAEAEPPRLFSIAISHETGTRGTAIAEAVGRRLDWKVYDHQLLEVMAGTMNVRVALLEDVDERHIGWLQDSLQRFAEVGGVSEASFARNLVETLLALAAQGECVILGRGSAFVLPPSTTLRVRLTAPLEERVTVISQERNLTRADAERFIERTDRERTEFVRRHFFHDPADFSEYDLMVNTGRFTDAECVDLIVDALHVRQATAGAANAPPAKPSAGLQPAR